MSASAARGVVLLALVSTQWSCMQPRGPAAPGAEPTRASSRAGPPPETSTLAMASAACDRVQASSEIPVSCTTEHVDDVPAMIVGFRNVEEAQTWLGPFAEHIGTPFCDAANRTGREARVYMTVGAGPARQARVWSCELGKWSDWFATAPETPAAPTPETVADAINACNDIQTDRDVPVTCRTEYVDGTPAMIVGFPDAAAAETYMAEVAKRVAAPFCNAANRASRRASLFITLARAQARHFDCERQLWGEWFELPGEEAPKKTLL